MDSKIAVLFQDDISLYRMITDKGETGRVAHIANMLAYGNGYGDLYNLMSDKDIERLWVYPDTDLSRGVRWEDFSLLPDEFEYYTPKKMIYDGQPSIARIRKRGDIDRYVIFCAHMECCVPTGGNRGQWDLSTPTHLYTTVDYIEQEIDMPLLWSGGHVGEEILRRSHSHKVKLRIRPMEIGQGYLWDIVQKAAMDRIVWKTRTPLSSTWWNSKFIVGFDKNGQYTGAANSVTVGNGGFREAKIYDGKSCGFWKYKITNIDNTAFNGVEMPCPLDVKREWASTSLVEAAHKVGVNFEIIEGIVWDEKGRYLEDWAREMWGYRKLFRDGIVGDVNPIAAKNAERSMKLYANSMVGRFMNEYSKEYHHPDWQIGIIHQAIASMTYTLQMILRDYGMTPVLVNKDAIYFLTDIPDVHQAIPGFTQHQYELRGYKPIGIAPLTDEIKEEFSKRKADINDIEKVIRDSMKGYYNELTP